MIGDDGFEKSGLTASARCVPYGRGRTCILVALFGAMSLADCASLDCTDIGDESQLAFNFNSVVSQHPNERLRVRACVDDVCRSTVFRKGQFPSVAFGEDVITDDEPRPVTLTIVDERSQVVFDGATTATPRKRQVNGDGCSPTTWQARVDTSGTSDLIATDS